MTSSATVDTYKTSKADTAGGDNDEVADFGHEEPWFGVEYESLEYPSFELKRRLGKIVGKPFDLMSYREQEVAYGDLAVKEKTDRDIPAPPAQVKTVEEQKQVKEACVVMAGAIRRMDKRIRRERWLRRFLIMGACACLLIIMPFVWVVVVSSAR